MMTPNPAGQTIPRPAARKLNPLTSLRFIAAVFIVIHHLRGSFGIAQNVLEPVALDNGVSFFFVLSGFILTYVYGVQPRLAKRRFLLARLARLWPAHVTALVCLTLLFPKMVQAGFSPLKLLANLALVQAWVPLADYNFSFVGPSWSISTEFGFYLCFLFLVNNWARTWWIKLPLTFAVLAGMIFLGNFLPGRIEGVAVADLRRSLVYIHPLARLFEFTLGMCSAELWRRAAPRVSHGPVLATIFELGAVALAGCTMARAIPLAHLAGRHPLIGPAGTEWLLHGGVSCVAFALLIFVMALEQGWLSRLLALPLPVLLGEISYSAYLVHQILIVYANSNHRAFAILPGWAALLVFVGVLLTLSYLIWAVIERPCRHFLVSLWPKPANAIAVELPASMISPDGLPVATRWTRLLLPSRAGIAVAGTALVVLCAGCYYLLKIRPTVEPVSASEVAEVVARTPMDLRGIHFGDRFVLLAADCSRTAAGIRLELIWQYPAGGRLEFHNAVHLVDRDGKICGHGDFEQDPGQHTVPAGTTWRDVVTFPLEKTKQANAVAIGLLRGTDWLFADRGPRDWGDRRVIIPLPAGASGPAASVASPSIQGFLEVADCQQIIGWVWDTAHPETRLTVEIFDGDQPVLSLAADHPRKDLIAAKVGDGAHSFQTPTPAQLKDGKPHSIHVRVAGESFELTHSPKTLACAPGSGK